MKFTLTAEQQQILLDWCGENMAADLAAECEPSGYRLEIEVMQLEVSVEAVYGSRRLDLGNAELELSSLPPASLGDPLLEDEYVRRRLESMTRSGK